QLIADEARRLTSTRFSMVLLLNGGDVRLSTFSGQPIPGLSVGFRMPADQSAVGASIRSGHAVLVTDVDNDPRANPEATRLTGAKSLLIVPLLTESQPIGAILVADKSAGALGPDDERVLGMLASGAVIQLENARLYQEEQIQRYDAEQRRQVAEGLRDILTILNSTRPLGEILESIVAQAGRLLGAGRLRSPLPDAGLARGGQQGIRCLSSRAAHHQRRGIRHDLPLLLRPPRIF
ncbi:MAG: GAF domain-containing protein, partial [Anaerolineae bacterium]